MKIKRTIIVTLVLAFFVFPQTANAQVFVGKPLTEDEIKEMIHKPQPRVSIPGLQFSDPKITVEKSGAVLLSVPFLGQFIAAVYRYALVTAGIFAVVMIIIAGIQWTISAGNQEIVTKARKKIGHALLGLFLLSISYTILYLVNPNLVIIDDISIGFIAPRDIETIVLPDKTILLFGPGSITGPIKKDTFDHIFKGFGNALGINYGVLKGIARVESNLKPLVKHPRTGYAGLFQTKEGNCQDTIRKYKDWHARCSDILNPWVNTAVGAVMTKNSLRRIEKECGSSISAKSAAALIYLGHNSGPGNLKRMVKVERGCPPPSESDENQQKRITRALIKSWEHYGKGESFAVPRAKYAHGKATDAILVEVAKTLGKAKDAVTFTDLKDVAVNGAAPNPFDNPPPSTISPALIGVDPNLSHGDISCSSAYDGQKVLVLGDSITAADKSYFDRISSNCPRMLFAKKAERGRSTTWMYNEIKDIDLRAEGYSHLVVLGGINNILPSVALKRSLTQIYDKGKTDGLRVIAVTIGPAEGWGSWTPNWQVSITEVNNWMKAQRGGNVDLVVDWNAVARREDNASILKDSYDSGDHLHPNPKGQERLAIEITRTAFR